MPIPLISFYLLSTVIVVAALIMVTRRNAIASAVFLAVTLLAVAALYVTVGAEFLFAVQVLVYTGGVMVLFLFVIMLVNVDTLAKVRPTIRHWMMPALLTTVSFAALVAFARVGRLREVTGESTAEVMGNTKAVALELFTGYLLPFEVVSVLLLVAMVGAILLAKKEL